MIKVEREADDCSGNKEDAERRESVRSCSLAGKERLISSRAGMERIMRRILGEDVECAKNCKLTKVLGLLNRFLEIGVPTQLFGVGYVFGFLT
jgi:hypothetical protein